MTKDEFQENKKAVLSKLDEFANYNESTIKELTRTIDENTATLNCLTHGAKEIYTDNVPEHLTEFIKQIHSANEDAIKNKNALSHKQKLIDKVIDTLENVDEITKNYLTEQLITVFELFNMITVVEVKENLEENDKA